MYNILNLDHYNSFLKINVFYSIYALTTERYVPINLYAFFLENDKMMIMMKMMVKKTSTYSDESFGFVGRTLEKSFMFVYRKP